MPFTEAEELGSKEVEIESKKFLVEVKSNEQGKFVKILEVRVRRGEERRVHFTLVSKPLCFQTHNCV